MDVLSPIRSYVSTYRARRRHYETEKLLRSLPCNIQKDIGWPGSSLGVDIAASRPRVRFS
ncbi:MAG: hypothetical protein JJ911_11725 [Rhizobiaceae bacterium]|nr:hypothetical protein [Rhizobiaceae bacterium]